MEAAIRFERASELVARASTYQTSLAAGALRMSIEDLAFKLKTASSTRTAALVGIITAIGGPIAIIAFGGDQASNVPWYIWAIASAVLLLVISAGYYLFTRNHDGNDISIRPTPR